jgi:RNA polymerase sigma-70 factor (ECF subfamily)
MISTSVSLLERLRQDEQAAWSRFVQLYTPLLYAWARRLGLNDHDAADLVQEVFAHLVTALPEFRYDKDRRFRGWLWTVALNVYRTGRRRRMAATGSLTQLVDEPAVPDPVEVIDEAEYRDYLVGRALKLVQGEFEPRTWQAFCDCFTADEKAAVVGARLGLSADAVYAAKSRVLRRLREELQGLLD